MTDLSGRQTDFIDNHPLVSRKDAGALVVMCDHRAAGMNEVHAWARHFKTFEGALKGVACMGTAWIMYRGMHDDQKHVWVLSVSLHPLL